MESARLSPLPINIYLLTVTLIALYVVGMALKEIYFWKFHSPQNTLQLAGTQEEASRTLGTSESPVSNPETAERCDAEGEAEAGETRDPESAGPSESGGETRVTA